MTKRWQLQADPDQTWSVLGHSAPFLIFLFFPIYDAYLKGIFSIIGLQIIISTLIFAATYLLTAIAVPVAPQDPQLTKRFIFWHAFFFTISISYFTLIYLNGGIGVVFYIMYWMSLWILQAPRPYIAFGASVSIIAATILSFFMPGEFQIGVVAVTLSGLSIWMSRKSIDDEQTNLERAAKDLLYAQERERNRISSDLHDTLGQTLTALSLKAELSQKMLEAGKTELAAKQLAQLQELTRKVLTEVRSVVAANRFLDLSEEIKAAEELCQSIKVSFQVEVQTEELTVEQRTICAYVLRESVTNALKHSAPTWIKIQTTPRQIAISNDINASADNRGNGLGLESLRQRIGDLGKLETKQAEGIWYLSVTFTQ